MTIPESNPNEMKRFEDSITKSFSDANKFASEGGVATYSSWGWYHNWKYRLRLPLSEAMLIVKMNTAGSGEALSSAIALMSEIVDTSEGVLSDVEIADLDKAFEEIESDLEKYFQQKKFQKNCRLSYAIIRKVRVVYKKLNRYQQQHGLLLPTEKVEQDFSGRIAKTFEGE